MRMVSKPISALGCWLLLANTLNINITQDKLASLLPNSTPRGAEYRVVFKRHHDFVDKETMK